MSSKQEEQDDVPTETIEEFLARGGKITKYASGQRTEDADIIMKWQRGRPKAKPAQNTPEN